MGRIENNCWIGVRIYNSNSRGQNYNQNFSNWVNNHLTMVNHLCFNGANFDIYNPNGFVNNGNFFGVRIRLQGVEIPNLFNIKCIFCINLNINNLNADNFTHDENMIIQFYNNLQHINNNSTVSTTKTLFAYWPDLFIPLDRTHNYNTMIFEFQTYSVDLPINRGNEIQMINGAKYVKILRVIQLQLRNWMSNYNTGQTDLRLIDNSMSHTPFMRVIDKNYW